ncbi:proton channel OTOP3-like [Protopterus annectens]|uniref:proton channel OTOP3-like n=1 Tax=Protopterus annectens TaxID=7888 RepID=UPI001CF96E0D|nr:proton channel OTOP3-like [Protopterus annectens]
MEVGNGCQLKINSRKVSPFLKKNSEEKKNDQRVDKGSIHWDAKWLTRPATPKTPQSYKHAQPAKETAKQKKQQEENGRADVYLKLAVLGVRQSAEKEAMNENHIHNVSLSSSATDLREPHMETRYEESWLHRHSSCSMQQKNKQARKAGRLFSGLFAINMIYLGFAMICSMMFSRDTIRVEEVQRLLMVLMVLSIFWMLYYRFETSNRPHAIHHQDGSAGSIWLRGSLVGFGGCSIIFNLFKLGYFFSYYECVSEEQIILPFINSAFIITQALFLWYHCKDCIQTQHNLTRNGLMLLLATNLLLWMLGVANDSVHKKIDLEIHAEQPVTGNSTLCICKKVTTCQVFKRGYIALFPFSLEYCLISSAMVFIMWKNVGRTTEHQSHHVPPKVFVQGIIIGPLLGTTVIVIGIGVFAKYQIQATTAIVQTQDLVLFYSFNIVILPFMSMCALAGIIVHSLEERELDTEENPARNLEVALLFVAALGPFSMSYFSIVAIVASDPKGLVNSLNLAYCIFVIVEHALQNVFITEGLHRLPTEEEEVNSHPKLEDKCFSPTVSLHSDMELFPNGHHAHTITEVEELTVMDGKDGHTGQEQEKTDCSSHKGSTTEMTTDSQQVKIRTSQSYFQTYKNLAWKRKTLKEISVFLVQCNIILWIMSAFGSHPQFENSLEKTFYGYSTWFSILNFGMPLGVFYRMHSLGGLVEVYIKA